MFKQVPERPQTRAHALEHRDAAGAQQDGRIRVDRARQVAEHHDRLVGLTRGVEHRELVSGVAVEFGDQVHGERDRVDGLVFRERGQRSGEELSGPGAGSPDVERVGREQTRIEQRFELGLCRIADRGEGYADLVGDIGSVSALETRVVDRRDATAVAGGPGRAAGAACGPEREQLERVGHVGQIADPVDAVVADQRFPPAVRAGQGAGVGGHHRPAARGVASGEQHDGQSAFGGPGEHVPQLIWLPHRLEYQPDHLRVRHVKRVGQVGRRRGDQFLA